MVKSPLEIIFELVFGLVQQIWDTITFSLSKLWELFLSLSFYSSQSLGLAIISAIIASAVTYFVLKYVFSQVPVRFVYLAIVGIITFIVVLIYLGNTFLSQ